MTNNLDPDCFVGPDLGSKLFAKVNQQMTKQKRVDVTSVLWWRSSSIDVTLSLVNASDKVDTLTLNLPKGAV